MPEPRPSLKDTAPQLHLLPIDESQRHAFIGQNAANLRAIEAATGVSLALEDLRSIVKVWAPSPAAFEEAKDAIHSLLHPPMPVRVGTVYRATVVDVLDFGLKLEVRVRRAGVCVGGCGWVWWSPVGCGTDRWPSGHSEGRIAGGNGVHWLQRVPPHLHVCPRSNQLVYRHAHH